MDTQTQFFTELKQQKMIISVLSNADVQCYSLLKITIIFLL